MARALPLLLLTLAIIAGGCVGTPPAGPQDDALAALDFREVVNAAKEKVFPAVLFVKCVIETHEGGGRSPRPRSPGAA